MFKGKKEIQSVVEVIRIKDLCTTYSLDFELDTFDEQNLKDFKFAHCKFIFCDKNKQISPYNLMRHVKYCSKILSDAGYDIMYGTSMDENQKSVKYTRHGKNWREKKDYITDNDGNRSNTKYNRLTRLYFRTGWVTFGSRKNDIEIAYLSNRAEKYLKDTKANKNNNN